MGLCFKRRDAVCVFQREMLEKLVIAVPVSAADNF